MAYESFSEAQPEKSLDEIREPEALDATMPDASGKRRTVDQWLGGWRGLVGGLGMGVAIATLAAQFAPGSHSSGATPTQSAAAPGQSVTIAPVERTRVTQSVDVTGSVAALDMLPISAQATGLQIQQILVEEGQTVEAGQVLAVLNSDVLKSQLNQAQADVVSAQAVVQQKQATLAQEQATLAQAETNRQRYQDLSQSGAVSRKDADSYVTAAKTAQESAHVAEANIASAEADVQSKIAQVQRLETQISQTLVRAPSRGIIAEKVARVGNVTGSDKLFSLIRDGSLELQAKVPETELAQINIGASAQITSNADKRINLQGRVREISPLVDPQTRQATVKIDLPASSLLRSGMFLKAAITIQTDQALTVPATAVLPQSDGRSMVYLLEGADTVRARSVEVGARQTAADPTQVRMVIKRGLQPGDRVVVAGAGYVKDGDRVTVVQN
ncbi:MAG TPA: efflux RND transporter periplasmic adaptor subunit [Coleofasciculaceae cyanobacterium]